MSHLPPNNVKGIVVHVSASVWGDRDAIDDWHRERGFSQIGYHGVILNGVRTSRAAYDIALDGHIQAGRPETEMGAHCLAKGMNTCSIGVCCIGNPGWPNSDAVQAPAGIVKPNLKYLTDRQLHGLVHWLAVNCKQYGLDPEGEFTRSSDGKSVFVISQHSDHDPGKPLCASLILPAIRTLVAAKLQTLP